MKYDGDEDGRLTGHLEVVLYAADRMAHFSLVPFVEKVIERHMAVKVRGTLYDQISRWEISEVDWNLSW